MRRRGYDLVSDWVLDAPVERVWDVLADPVLSWPRWWPGMSARSVAANHRGSDRTVGHDAVVGSSADLEVRPWRRGYRLRLSLRVESARPPRQVLLRATGDLDGTAEVLLADHGVAGTRVHIEWNVATCRAWMNLTAGLLAPAFAAQHHHTMLAGEAGLRAYLARRGTAEPIIRTPP